jgi:hypothetical protein
MFKAGDSLTEYSGTSRLCETPRSRTLCPTDYLFICPTLKRPSATQVTRPSSENFSPPRESPRILKPNCFSGLLPKDSSWRPTPNFEKPGIACDALLAFRFAEDPALEDR